MRSIEFSEWRSQLRKRLVRLAPSFRKVAHDSQGATAVEFALVLFPFMLLMGSIVEVGVMLFAEYTLQNAVQDASRQIQTGQIGTAPVNQFKTNICNSVAMLPECTTKIGLYVQNADTFTALADGAPPATQVQPGQSIPFNPGEGRKAVAVIATYDWQFTFPFMQVFNNVVGARRLQGVAVFQNEAFSDS